MSKPFDATLKDLFDQDPADWRQAFSLPTLEPVRVLNVDLSTISAATDVAFGFGEPMQEIVDLNFQSGPDSAVAARLLLYNAALHLKYGVPVRSILVLLRPKADARRLDGKLSYVSGGHQVSFDYGVVRLWKQPLEVFLGGGLGLLPLAPLCRMPAGKPLTTALHDVAQEIDRRLHALPDHAKAVRLMTAAFILTGLRVPERSLSRIFEGITIMHKTVAFDEWVERAEKRLKEGVLKGEIRILVALGREHFGDPGPKMQAGLDAIDDPDRLERMAKALLTVKSWKALLAVK